MTDIRTDSAARPGKRNSGQIALCFAHGPLEMLAGLRQERAQIDEAMSLSASSRESFPSS